jgi:hypothetical protein
MLPTWQVAQQPSDVGRRTGLTGLVDLAAAPR